MRPLSFLRGVYSLDSLDTRLTASSLRSSSPPKNPSVPSLSALPAADAASESPQSRRIREEASPPRWRTPEFFVYYVVFAIAVPMMFKAACDVSKVSNPNYNTYKKLLSRGWIPGRRVDNSDAQYASFRDNIPILSLVLLVHSLLRRLFDYAYMRLFPAPPPNSSYRPSHNLARRKAFDILFALIFLSALHSLSVLKILFILLANFLISYFHPSSIMNPILTWVFNIGVLFANEYYQGYRFRDILPGIIAGEGSGVGYAMDHVLDGGLLPRWEISFNISVLRLISYNMDHYWAAVAQEEGGDPAETEQSTVLEVRDQAPGPSSSPSSAPFPERASGEESRVGLPTTEREEDGEEDARLMDDFKKKKADPANISERDRVNGPADFDDYGLLNYLAYVLYSPLYLAGPIITFNDFVHQQRHPPSSITATRTLSYALRLVVCILCMELVLHYIYVVAISKTASDGSWVGATPFQLSMIGYFNLHIIWLKLLIPWRFFRLWSLVDSLDPPENMLRCMSNNYSALAFWRSWHRSFNRWTVRYVYVPLGGARRPVLNMLAVFTFVALWHDLSLRLLAWGWLVVLFVLPEIMAGKLAGSRRGWEERGKGTVYRMLKGVGAVANVLMMMVANLVGYAIGVDGVKELGRGILGSWGGLGYALCACSALFVGVQIMFEIRESEKRKGINLKC